MGASLAADSPLACVEFQMAGSVVLCVSVCLCVRGLEPVPPRFRLPPRAVSASRGTQGCWVDLLFAFSFVLIVPQLSLRPPAALLS